MKRSVLSLPRSFATLALLASGLSFVQNAFAAQASTPSGPVVIPGGNVTSTYVISAPGAYVLAGNRTLTDVTKHAIEIKAPDVTLDLGGFTLAHSAVAGGTGSLIYCAATENLEVRNGTLSNAAKQGIVALAGKGFRVLDVRVATAGGMGIQTNVPATQIDRCNVSDTASYGIWALGAGSLITDCVFNGCQTGVQTSFGSRIARSVVQGGSTGLDVGTGSTVADCTVSVSGAMTRGIAAVNATLRNVDVTGAQWGIWCNSTNVVITGSRISGNTLNVYGTYTDAGGNYIP